MKSLSVVLPLVASALWLVSCGARSGVRCFGDVCLADDEVGVSAMGGSGSELPARPPRTAGAGATTEVPRAPEGPSEQEWMRDPGSELCAESGTAPGSVYVETASDLAALEGCRRIEGDLTISSFRAADLRPLSSLIEVSGVLSINMTGSLSGLESLERVGHLVLAGLEVPTLEPLKNLTILHGAGEEGEGSLSISASPSLQSLTGLGSLRTLGAITIVQNPALETLAGLSVPSHVEDLVVDGNPRLRDLAGLANLTSFGRFDLRDNAALTQLRGLGGVLNATSFLLSDSPALSDTSDLGRLATIRSLMVDNVGLSTLDGFAGLREARYINVENNPNLTQIDALARLSELTVLTVTDNPSLVRLPDFQEATSVNRVLVRNNAQLVSGPRFPHLAETSTVSITRNPSLTRVDGFPELRAVRNLEVRENQALLEVQLGTLQSADRLRILCNPNLPEAPLMPLLSLGDVDVRGNLGSTTTCDP